MDNFSLGITLMLVGMITVFAILLIVIYLSRLLIALLNRFAPAEVSVPRDGRAMDAAVLRVIDAAVKKITGGSGAVKHVERL